MRYVPFFLFSSFLIPTADANPDSSHRDTRTISVSGAAEVKVVPDRVIASFTVENRGESLVKTQQKNDAVVTTFLSYLTDDLKIPAQNMQTDHFQVAPQYYYCYDNNPREKCDPMKVQYYNVYKNIQIQLDDISQYEDLVNKAFELGITQINGVQFLTTELRKHRDNAREMAAIAAREKAEAVAGTLDMKVLKPINIHLNQSSWAYQQPMYNRGSQTILNSSSSVQATPQQGSALALGQISISAEVDVVFEME